LGYERMHNPVLQKTDRNEFIEHKVSEDHFQPPYFKQMERYNLEGAPPLDKLPCPQPFSPAEFAKGIDEGMLVVDIRSPEAFAGAHVPGSYSLPLDMLPAFAGMFLYYDKPLGLVVENPEQIDTAVRGLTRIGYDNIPAFLAGGLHAWETDGRQYDTISTVHVSEVEKRLDNGNGFTLLDVRSKEEYLSGHLRNAVQIYLGELPYKLDKIPPGRPVTTFCGSGQRAMIAAALLRQNGIYNVEDCLGSMDACSSVECHVIKQE
ncbi:MAG: rhodanese-like domain-containing protein, partial [Pirellulales bacterium]|nr:rhodanese-like domain-containing protein [Pirellulales bacterium]